MKLNVFERLTLLQELPKEGNYATLKIISDLRSKLSFTENDFKEFDLKQKGDNISWNQKGNEPKDLEIGEKATDIIRDCLNKLDKESKLDARTFGLFEKFIGIEESN